MKTLLLGLIQGPVAWLAVSAGISVVLQQPGASPSSTIGVSLLAGGFAWAAIGLSLAAVGNWRSYAALSGGAEGVAPTDGRPAILVGTIEADGPLLRAPFDDRPCVAYRYNITDHRGQGRRRSFANVFRGVALTPSRILTRTGSYRLLVVPEFETDGPEGTRAAQVASFRAYAARTAFIPQAQGADELLAQWADNDGHYRSDVRYFQTAAETPDDHHWVLRQHRVAAGARVCAFGTYSREKGGLVPSFSSTARLVVGDATEVADTQWRTAQTRLAIAVVMAGAAAGLLARFLNA